MHSTILFTSAVALLSVSTLAAPEHVAQQGRMAARAVLPRSGVSLSFKLVLSLLEEAKELTRL